MKISKPFTRSTLSMTCAGLLMLTTSLSTHANDGDRITQLEKQVQELKLRLSNLEAQRTQSDGQAQQKATGSKSEASRSASALAVPRTDPKVLAKWRGLERGMSQDDVKGALGTPQKMLSGSAFTYWDYANQGSVTFHQGRLSGWTEPN